MPIYEYLCRKCGEFETMQRITEAALEKCPTCDGKVRRLISQTSFQLKGTGWYVTDYARSGDGKKTSGDAQAGGDGASTGESKSESKAEAKSEGKASASGTATSTP